MSVRSKLLEDLGQHSREHGKKFGQRRRDGWLRVGLEDGIIMRFRDPITFKKIL